MTLSDKIAEALSDFDGWQEYSDKQHEEALNAILLLFASELGEPVAWLIWNPDNTNFILKEKDRAMLHASKGSKVQPLYAAIPPAPKVAS